MFEHGLFADWMTLLMGAGTGLVFGFLLQKAYVTRADTIIGQFLLRDFTVLKVMLTAVVVGGIGVYALRAMGVIETMHVKNAAILGNLAGGVIFGVGMAILGYCPGTGVAAIGDGSRDAIAGVLGMVFGAAVFAEVYPALDAWLLKPLDLGKMTLPDAAHVSVWIVLVALVVVVAVVFGLVERWEHRRPA
jgi:hypothetical protein